MTIHDLRHTAASLAISAGATVKPVQRMLGYKSAAMILDVYADLFDDDLSAVSDALDQARTAANAVNLLSRGDSGSTKKPVALEESRAMGLPKWTRRRESNPQRLQV
ncbi:tyrosine-type recombinase/integrase [Microbacterium sp. PAMC22086]|nr:tyrosine-type recombinase/integrase [Microbacterium sp. PAMC22086]